MKPFSPNDGHYTLKILVHFIALCHSKTWLFMHRDLIGGITHKKKSYYSSPFVRNSIGMKNFKMFLSQDSIRFRAKEAAYIIIFSILWSVKTRCMKTRLQILQSHSLWENFQSSEQQPHLRFVVSELNLIPIWNWSIFLELHVKSDKWKDSKDLEENI